MAYRSYVRKDASKSCATIASLRSPGDYEAELVRLCQGDRRKAARLILEELERSPGMSRQGAALALVTRIRHERAPYPRPL